MDFLRRGGRFPGGVFTSKEKAEPWISKNCLTGVLTKYPVDVGSFDWAKLHNVVGTMRVPDPDFIGSFSSASFEHFHYEVGELVC